MKTLLVLRHAKSSRDDPSLQDHARPLNDRGLRDAPRAGAMLKEKDLIPDAILCSPAVRAQDTARLAAKAAKFTKPIETVADFYPGDPRDYIQELKNLPDDLNRVMVVGHNPGLEELVWHLSGGPQELPTASVTHFELPVEHWNELSHKTRAKLIFIWRPKENP
jgi:phosphohistidine phosphatase